VSARTAPASNAEWGVDRIGPAWAARAYAPAGGQDHLGLGSVSSDRILPMLAPGINVLTIHPRYWSVYAWILDDFWAHDLPRTRASFVQFYRPREALFAFACQLCDAAEHSSVTGNIVGSRRTAGEAQTATEFEPGYDYIKEALGGFGLYYRSAMETTGLVERADPTAGLPYDTVTSAGKALAAAYRSEVADTQLVRTFLASPTVTGPVPRTVLEEFARRGCLCQLRKAKEADLPLLRDLFTHVGDPTGARRGTLRYLLDLCTTTNEDGLNQDRFRQLIYFRSLDDKTYVPQAGTAEIARRWRLYQAREYFGFALNRLWAWFARRGLDWSSDGLALVPLTDVWNSLRDELNTSYMPAGREVTGTKFTADTLVADLVTWLMGRVDVTGDLNAVWPRDGAVDEHELFRWCSNASDDADTLVAMMSILLLVYQRIGTPARLLAAGSDMDIVREGGALRIGMARFFAALQRELKKNPTLIDLLTWIYSSWIIPQHERVAAAKLVNGDTFRFRRVGTAVQFFHQDAPAVLNDSRYLALSTTVHELGLVSALHQPQRKLTATGKTLLSAGDLATGAMAAAIEALTAGGA
jgi:hypothetical protein